MFTAASWSCEAVIVLTSIAPAGGNFYTPSSMSYFQKISSFGFPAQFPTSTSPSPLHMVSLDLCKNNILITICSSTWWSRRILELLPHRCDHRVLLVLEECSCEPQLGFHILVSFWDAFASSRVCWKLLIADSPP